ncbi:MAG: hypothetical protein L3J97_05070 [Thermoplasmata archaeon]|nr:hypothetical protein [Thermoplasmata archaeon]
MFGQTTPIFDQASRLNARLSQVDVYLRNEFRPADRSAALAAIRAESRIRGIAPRKGGRWRLLRFLGRLTVPRVPADLVVAVATPGPAGPAERERGV